MGVWADSLERSSFRGVEFNCQTVDDDLDRRTAEHVYPYRDGAEHEDMGRRARSCRLRAVFMQRQDGAELIDYTKDLGDLITEVDKGEAGLFQHPILGAWMAIVRRTGIHHEHGMRDAATVELEVVEEGIDTVLPELQWSISALEQAVEVECVAVEAEAVVEGTSTLDEVVQAVADIRAFAVAARNAGSKLAANIDKVRSRVNSAVEAVRDLGDVETYPLVRSIRRAGHAATQLARRIANESPPVITKLVKVPCSLTVLAHSLYADGTRADEILSLNRVRNPFLVPAGTLLKVPSR